MKRLNGLAFSVLASLAVQSGANAAPAQTSAPAARPTPAQQPNILVILADDMGWSDIGAFGGEIGTPNLDRLAKRGVRFTNFHASPYCSPSRAMLLTGADSHEVGFGNMAELLSPEQRGRPGYEGYLNNRATTIAQRLSAAGYRTLMAGKWHLGSEDSQSPAQWGFSRSFAMLRGEANHFRHDPGAPSPDGADIYRLDGRTVDIPPDFYSSDYYADTLNGFINEQRPGQPFFAYLAFTAPHSPLQAPEADIAKYRGRYDAGPQALARARLARLRAMGLIARKAPPHPLVGTRAWNEMTAEQRALSARRMETYAAMIDRMDRAIGRVIDNLRKRGELDRTIIYFMSDNGAAGASRETNPKWGPWIAATMDNRLTNIGAANSYVSTGPDWAQASMAPSYLFKGYLTEGGTHSPMIVAGPSVAKGGVNGSFAQLVDIVPTILRQARVASQINASQASAGQAEINGRDLVPALRKPRRAVSGPQAPVAMEMRGARSVRAGDWKAVMLPRDPAGLAPSLLPQRRWQLFNLRTDPGETTDLSAQHPDILTQLTSAYANYGSRVGVAELTDTQR